MLTRIPPPRDRDSLVNRALRKSKLDDGQRRGIRRGIVVWIAGFVITLVILALLAFVGGKAHAQCVAGSSDSTCPNPAAFAQKYRSGFFDHAHGLPVKKVLKTPARDRAKYVRLYVRMWNHAGPTKRSRLSHYVATRTTGKTVVCQFPLTAQCAASVNWSELVAHVKCGMWHSWPDVTDHFTCDRFATPLEAGQCGVASCQKPLTWAQFRNGLKVSACAVGTGLAGFAVVASRGSTQSLLGLFVSGSGCAATLAEAASAVS